MAQETFRSDGKAVDVVVDKAVEKGDPILAQGWHGISMGNAASGGVVAVEVAEREHLINVGAVAAAKGAILYLTPAGALSATSNTGANRAAFKVTKAKDSNNVCWAKILPNLV
jgi:hypothetical protein